MKHTHYLRLMSNRTTASRGLAISLLEALHTNSDIRSDLRIWRTNIVFRTKPWVELKSLSYRAESLHHVTFGEGSPGVEKLRKIEVI